MQGRGLAIAVLPFELVTCDLPSGRLRNRRFGRAVDRAGTINCGWNEDWQRMRNRDKTNARMCWRAEEGSSIGVVEVEVDFGVQGQCREDWCGLFKGERHEEGQALAECALTKKAGREKAKKQELGNAGGEGKENAVDLIWLGMRCAVRRFVVCVL